MIYTTWDGNLSSNMVIRESEQDGWFGMMIIWFWYVMGFLGLVLVPALDSKDQFSEHVTWLNSATMSLDGLYLAN